MFGIYKLLSQNYKFYTEITQPLLALTTKGIDYFDNKALYFGMICCFIDNQEC